MIIAIPIIIISTTIIKKGIRINKYLGKYFAQILPLRLILRKLYEFMMFIVVFPHTP